MGTAAVKKRNPNSYQKQVKGKVGAFLSDGNYQNAAKIVAGAFISNMTPVELKAIAFSASTAYSAYKRFTGKESAQNRFIVSTTLKALGGESIEVSTRLRKTLRLGIMSAFQRYGEKG